MRYLLALVLALLVVSAADARPILFPRLHARVVHRERVVHIERGHGLLGFGVVGVQAAPCATCAAPAVVPVPTPKKEEPKKK